MIFEWNEAKRLANLKKHGVDFDDAVEFDWEKALTTPDLRVDYGEPRFNALAEFRGRIHAIAYALRGAKHRLISFRRASNREARRYEKEKDQFA